MIILANILNAVATLLDGILYFYVIVIFARVVISWLNADPFNPIVRFIINMTEPVFSWLRKRVPLTIGMIDLSPILVMLIISFIRIALVQSLADYANLLRLNAMH